MQSCAVWQKIRVEPGGQQRQKCRPVSQVSLRAHRLQNENGMERTDGLFVNARQAGGFAPSPEDQADEEGGAEDVPPVDVAGLAAQCLCSCSQQDAHWFGALLDGVWLAMSGSSGRAAAAGVTASAW